MKRLKSILVISLLLNGISLFFLITGLYSGEIPKKIRSLTHTPKSKYFMGKDLVFAALPKDSNAIVFLGDSHTEHFYLHELLGNTHLQNRGISSDRLRGILKRLDPILASQPEKIFIQAGINDLGTGGRMDTIRAQYMRLIDILKTGSPRSKLYVQSLFPVDNKLGSAYCNPAVNKAVVELNRFLKAQATQQGYTFIDIYSTLAQDGKLNPLYAFDGVHLTAEGYLVWAKLVKPYVAE